MLKKKPQNKKVDDDEVPIRQRVREVMDGKIVTVVMTSLTLFALFGDDFRLWFFSYTIDMYFYSFLTVALVMFLMEIMVNSCVQDEFQYSFFFWLDIIATLSLLPDIQFIVILF
jgi:hypothetical protein